MRNNWNFLLGVRFYEALNPPATMKLQNPDAKILEETSGSSGFFSFSQESDGMASGFEALESIGICVGPNEAIGNNADEIGCVVENFPANDGSKEENEGLSRGGDTVRKIEVSGENLSLVVDFSSSLTEVSGRNAYESHGLKKENEGDQQLGYVVGDIVWVLRKYQNWWPGEVVDLQDDKKESLLVRYFEESDAFQWLSPSWLRPFNQNMGYMLKQGKGKSFTRAVEKAMALFGDSLKLEMTCPENGKRWKLKPSLLHEFSVDRMEPEEFVAQLKNIAKCSSVYGMLELTVMQSRLSAFYTFLGHKKIPMDQLCEKAGKQSLSPTKMKPKKKVQEGSIHRKRAAAVNIELSRINGGAIDSENQNSSGTRDRKRSKYLSYPFVVSEATEGEKVMEESANKFIGCPSAATGSSRKRFQREWNMKFISGKDNASNGAELANTSLSDLISELRLLAMNYQYSKETDQFRLIEWFFSKFRMSMFHDECIYEMQCKNNLILAKEANPNAGQNTSKREYLAKSEIEPLASLSDVITVPVTYDFCTNTTQERISARTLIEKTPEAEDPITLVPDLNGGISPLNFVEPDHSQRLNTLVFPEVSRLGGETRSMMLNFQVTGPSSSDNISGAGFVFVQPGSDMNLNLSKTDFLTHNSNPGKAKREWKRKRKEDHLLAMQSIPDLNGLIPDTTSPLPQEKPVQCKRRRKKDEFRNGETKGTTILVMKFTPGVSMPSKDDLTSKFSGFGPLDATETHASKDSGSAQVAFVSSGDAIEAVKSLEKTNPYGETLVSFRLQQKPAIKRKNKAPRMPVISVCPAPGPCEPPMSVDVIRQNLMMMMSMLEQSGDTLSEEMKVKLKSEISGLLEKVSSMPSSSSF